MPTTSKSSPCPDSPRSAVIEDGATFEANASKKAEHYSKYAEGELVIADDSGLEVDALQGAPGVRSARYAADEARRSGRRSQLRR